MFDPTPLLGELLDSLEDQIAVIDARGSIVYVNDAWVRFGNDNGLGAEKTWVGGNYLQVCGDSAALGDSQAGTALAGILDVLQGRRDAFYHEYPCHSPSVQRWFMMRVVPLRGHADSLFVVSHINITQRKFAEQRLENLSLSDPLTGLANRRHFDRFLNGEWSRALRATAPVSLVMLDIDHFKAYNDELGHVAGDRCLCQCGQVLRAYARRPSDLAARYGGEEFALILGNTDQPGALREAEAIRADIEAMHLAFDDGARITASLGVASVVPRLGQVETELVDCADKALYRAKHAGRNRVECVPG
jgi:diguanylate cyclase (GGDEF)-like protein